MGVLLGMVIWQLRKAVVLQMLRRTGRLQLQPVLLQAALQQEAVALHKTLLAEPER